MSSTTQLFSDHRKNKEEFVIVKHNFETAQKNNKELVIVKDSFVVHINLIPIIFIYN